MAVYTAEKSYGYDFILGATAFSAVDYGFANKHTKKHMLIDYDREAFGAVKFVLNDDGTIMEKDGKLLVSAFHTFYQDE